MKQSTFALLAGILIFANLLIIVWQGATIKKLEATVRGLECSLERSRAQLETETKMNQQILKTLGEMDNGS